MACISQQGPLVPPRIELQRGKRYMFASGIKGMPRIFPRHRPRLHCSLSFCRLELGGLYSNALENQISECKTQNLRESLVGTRISVLTNMAIWSTIWTTSAEATCGPGRGRQNSLSVQGNWPAHPGLQPGRPARSALPLRTKQSVRQDKLVRFGRFQSCSTHRGPK